MVVRSFIAVSLLAAAAASANIVSVAGMTTQIGPPPAANPFGLNGPNAYAFNEQQGVFVPPTPVNMLNNPGTSGAPVPGFFTGLVDSHLIHFAPLIFPGNNAIGSVTFSQPIVAVIWDQNLLDLSDPIVGAGGTAYPTFDPVRGMMAPSFLSVNVNVLHFDLWTTLAGTVDYEQVRVYTRHIPAPGAMALLGLAGVIARRRR